jgi:hypothetical protein
MGLVDLSWQVVRTLPPPARQMNGFSKGARAVMDWTSDFRHASRGLLRTLGFLVTTVLTLALAIGAVVGMFNVVYTVLLRPLPFPESDRLVVLNGSAPGSDLPERFGPGQEFYLHYKERSQLLDGIFLFGAGTSTLRTDDRVERVPMAFPSNDIYATLGARPAIGRLPTPEDEDRVVVISDRSGPDGSAAIRPSSGRATSWPVPCGMSSASCRRTSAFRAMTRCYGSRARYGPRRFGPANLGLL